ncbi:hypothetical protein APHAL10511_007964 [Amanita phalloides]|nr:hypothetical protein APHAL10511_007964 [Amanita phalloides]
MDELIFASLCGYGRLLYWEPPIFGNASEGRQDMFECFTTGASHPKAVQQLRTWTLQRINSILDVPTRPPAYQQDENIDYQFDHWINLDTVIQASIPSVRMSHRTGSTSSRRTGLNTSSVTHTSRRFLQQKEVLAAAKEDERMSASVAKRRRIIEEMTFDERNALADMDTDASIGNDDVAAVNAMVPPIDMEIEVSHEGGEVEMFSDLASEIANTTGQCHRLDNRNRGDRIEQSTKNWAIQMDSLVQAYLYFQSIQGVEGLSSDLPVVGSEEGEAPSIQVVDLFYQSTPLPLSNDYSKILERKYDIGCIFQKTLANSSIGPEAKKKAFQLMVGAFHGHAHNHSCQLAWHPMYIKGTGKSEGEGCEHVFLATNDLARTTRYASRFHRHQALEEYFTFWEEDKYTLLSKFISNHYRDAAEEIHLLQLELEEATKLLQITVDDFGQYIEEEKTYLENLKKPSPEVETKGRYVEVLNELYKCKQEWAQARASVNQTLEMVTPVNALAAVAQARKHVDTTYSQLQHAEALVGTLEGILNIAERWTAETSEYKQYHEENIRTKYQWITKLSSSGTGYKLHRQIAKALQRRSEAIQKAITHYNAQAAKLDPPHQQLSWKDVVDFSFLGEFNLLRFSKLQSEKEWMRPAVREAITKYLKLSRVHEEIERLNIEVQRLRRSIEDEERHVKCTIEQLEGERLHLLTGELRRRWRLQSKINLIHLKRLDRLESEPYYTGKHGSDKHMGEMAPGGIETADEIEEENSSMQQDFEVVADFIIGIDD